MEIVEQMTDDAIDVRPSELFDEAVSVVEIGDWTIGLIDDRLVLKRDDDVAVID